MNRINQLLDRMRAFFRSGNATTLVFNQAIAHELNRVFPGAILVAYWMTPRRSIDEWNGRGFDVLGYGNVIWYRPSTKNFTSHSVTLRGSEDHGIRADLSCGHYDLPTIKDAWDRATHNFSPERVDMIWKELLQEESDEQG